MLHPLHRAEALERCRCSPGDMPVHCRKARSKVFSLAKPTGYAICLIERLATAALRDIEVTSFVSPKWVPQMADQADVMCGLRRRAGVNYPVRTPNLKGFEAAVAEGATEVALFAATSERFSQKNINCSIDASIDRFVPVLDAAKCHGVRVRGYVSCVVACSCDGAVAPRQVARVAARLHDLGCHEVSLGDTIGVGTPGCWGASTGLILARSSIAVPGFRRKSAGITVRESAAPSWLPGRDAAGADLAISEETCERQRRAPLWLAVPIET
jgi:hypothetical protein